MTEFPLPVHETARLAALHSYQILDTQPEEAFDGLTRLAAQICETPIALVSLVDETRQWFKAHVGLDASQTCREVAFCNYTICQPDIFIVSDALADPRFATNPLVTNDPQIRFYAGVPLITPAGHSLGTLCVIDRVARSLSPLQCEALQTLGRQVMAQLELRRNLTDLIDRTHKLEQTEAVARESEQRFRTIADSSPVLIWIDDENKLATFCNQSWLNFTGRTLEQELGYGWQQNIHPDDVQHWRDTYNAAFDARQTYQLEYRVRRFDGEYRWLLETGAPRFLLDGTFIGYTGSCIDITERRQSEAALRQSEEQFRQLAEHIHEVFWIYSPPENRFLYVSPAYQTLSGHTCQSLYAEPSSWLEAVLPEYRTHLTTCLQSQQPYDEEYAIQHADGSVRWIRDRAFPICDAAGTVYRIVGTAEDITKRKQAQQEVQLLQTMSQAIFESTDFHSALEVALQKVCEATHWDFGEAWVPRPDRTALECSPAWYTKTERLTTFRQQSQSFSFPPGVGIPGRIWVSKQPEWCRNVSVSADDIYLRSHMAISAGLGAALGIPLLANDEVITVLVFYMFEARDEDVRLIELISASTELGLFIQRKQVEEEVHRSLAKERELNQLKSNFISMVSHEFRTPLTSILLAAELLEKANQPPEKKRGYFNRIYGAVKRMNHLMEDVLLIGKGERGKLEFNPVPLDLKQFCDDLVTELRSNVGERYTLVFQCEGDFAGVHLDPHLLHHLLNNLLSNAIKYSPEGSRVSLKLAQQAGAVLFKVQDSGIGIPLADQPHLFEFFHRATNVSTIPGTGLGLAIVKQCVDLHGGQVSVDSAVGQGTTFTVVLPLVGPCPEAKQESKQQP